ncbi:filamentous hemagglutinin family, partial [Candidatus Magnetomorum sp. HK-1]
MYRMYRMYLIILFLLVFNFTFPASLYCLPQGGNVTHGEATISQPSAVDMHIQQTTDKTVINWKQFDIYKSETVSFIQPSKHAIALNRVMGVNSSFIDGLLSANGRVFLLNPHGVLIGKNGQVNVNGFLASTLNMKDSDFINDRFVFEIHENQSLASIINKGSIKTKDGGFVSLLGSSVKNEGAIIANMGTVQLGSGKKMELNFEGNNLINFIVDSNDHDEIISDSSAETEQTGIEHKGSIQANGGKVLISSTSARSLMKSVINIDGDITADTVDENTGQIDVQNHDGGVNISGKIQAVGNAFGNIGGQIKINGKNVKIENKSLINASGETGGGQILIGANFSEKELDNFSETVEIDQEVSIKANAVQSGSGGDIVIWSDVMTKFDGQISARGGAVNGDGGFVELSGKKGLAYNGRVNLSAPSGNRGLLLLDPKNIVVGTINTNDEQLDDQNILIDDSVDENFNISIAKLIEELNNADVTMQASASISIEEKVDASENINLGNLTLTAPIINLNEKIYLNGELKGGEGNNSVNVGAKGLIGNAIDLIAENKTINLVATTYDENIDIDKSINFYVESW